MSYTDQSEIEEALNNLNETFNVEKPSTSFMTVIGCLNYQLGKYSESQQWLTRAFNESKDQKTKSVAAAALGLIYLKESEKKNIEPYIAAAKTHYLGQWMLVLYYLEHYRESNHKEYLLSAIKYMEEKHTQEGTTTATERLLKHMKLISSMEDVCTNDPDSISCSIVDLGDEKRYLFSTAYGFLSMLLKKPPLNNM